MEKRFFLFKVLVIQFLIYFIVVVAAFFKCYKQATADDLDIAPARFRFDIPKEGENFVLSGLILDNPKNPTQMQEISRGTARGFREI